VSISHCLHKVTGSTIQDEPSVASVTFSQAKQCRDAVPQQRQKGVSLAAKIHTCRLDRINQVDLPLDGFYSSGEFDGRGVHGKLPSQ
jgi:hypothetical protein